MPLEGKRRPFRKPYRKGKGYKSLISENSWDGTWQGSVALGLRRLSTLALASVAWRAREPLRRNSIYIRGLMKGEERG